MGDTTKFKGSLIAVNPLSRKVLVIFLCLSTIDVTCIEGRGNNGVYNNNNEKEALYLRSFSFFRRSTARQNASIAVSEILGRY